MPPHNNNHHGGVAADANFLEEIDVNQASSVIDLHRSNLLRIQAEQLVEECRIKQDASWVKVAQAYMDHVGEVVSSMTIQSNEMQDLPASPFSTKLSDRKSAATAVSVDNLQVSQPSHPFIGLSTLQGNANVLPTFTLHVKCSKSILEPKDYLRNRYFDKRNRIVWAVALQLQKKHFTSIGQVYWHYVTGDVRRVQLLLVPPTQQSQVEAPTKSSKKQRKQKKGKQQSSVQGNVDETATLPRTKTLKFRVQLEFGFGLDSLDWIPPLRLLPNRCNLATGETNGAITSSQMYNHVLMEDAFFGPMNINEHDIDDIDEIQAVLQASFLLAKTWCLQRGMFRAHDGFDSEQLLALLVYLFRTKRVNARMGPTQVLAALWKLLVSTDWLGEHSGATLTDLEQRQASANLIRVAPSEAYQGEAATVSVKRTVLVVPRPNKTENQTVATCKMAQSYAQQVKESPLTDHDPSTLLELWETMYLLGPVLLDSTMRYNFLGRISPSFMRDLQQQSQLALDRLHERMAFDTLFMRRARFWSRYDVYMRLPLKEISFASELWGHDRADLGHYETIARGMVQVLTRALGDRVHAIRIFSTGNGLVKNQVDAVRDSDDLPVFEVNRSDESKMGKHAGRKETCPNGSAEIVIGVIVNSDTCYRIVDRGPPADDVQATTKFLQLWGKKRAQLRRFKDGAIVHAVVWDSTVEDDENTSESSYIRFHNDDKQQGGIIERIMRHILKQHFISNESAQKSNLQFSLRNMMSAIDGVLQQKPGNDSQHLNQLSAHRLLLKAFDSLVSFLRTNSAPTIRVEGSNDMISRLGVPLPVDAVEPVSPALRYAELFPATPHPDLGASLAPKVERLSGAIVSNPIDVQIRFGASSKWPTDIKAIGAAKTAMLVSLVDGIEKLKLTGTGKGFDGPMMVTTSYADIGYMGFVFRIRVRADPELKLLRSLSQPSPEAASLLQLLTKRHVVAATHHSMVHAVYTSHPSSSAVSRLAKRWVSSHMLSGHLPFEALELLVVHVYTDKTFPHGVPGSVTAGFMRFLDLLSDFDWVKQAMIVDPQGQFDEDATSEIQHQFEKVRGSDWKHGPPMYIVAPTYTSVDEAADLNSRPDALPIFTRSAPELVVLLRATALARRTYDFLHNALTKFEANSWCAAFQETTSSFRSYSALLRVDADFCIDPVSSSTGSHIDVEVEKDGLLSSGFTRSMKLRVKGPKGLQRKAYRNLENRSNDNLLLEFNPVDQVVSALRAHLGTYLLVFYNDLCPEVLSILWRRPRMAPHAFAAAASEFARPVILSDWKNDTLVTVNVMDLLRSMTHYTRDIVVDYKVFDQGLGISPASLAVEESKPRAKRKDMEPAAPEESDSDSD
ncbi:hypothetical protein MPSEU_000118300 [Mayamaea pseudoterrestris]|nr:hypothetical protein MPSEU_000118300 [Mayamaea pseudoterrestris]